MFQAFTARAFSSATSMNQSRGAERATRIPRSGLNEEIRERTLLQDARVRNTVEGDAARHAQVLRRHPLLQPARLGQKDLFEDDLQTSSNVLMERFDASLRSPRFASQKLDEARRMHSMGLKEIEILQVQAVLSSLTRIDKLMQLFDIAGSTIGREPHDFVFTFIYFEAQITGNRAV